MRLIKMFGLAVMAVAIVMAFVGATSAMAVTELEEVVFCHKDLMLLGHCNNFGEDFPEGTVIHWELESGSTAVLLTSLGNWECAEAKLLGKTSSLLAHGLIESASLSGCKLGGTSCTVTTEHLPYLFLVLLTTGHEEYHAIVSEHGTSGKPQELVKCGALINCSFGAAELLYEVLLKEHDTVWDVLQELSRTGGLCPSTSTWHAKFLVRCLNASGVFEDCWPSME